MIKLTYTNRTSATVYWTKLQTRLDLEKKVGDEWVVAKRDAIPLEADEENLPPVECVSNEFEIVEKE